MGSIYLKVNVIDSMSDVLAPVANLVLLERGSPAQGETDFATKCLCAVACLQCEQLNTVLLAPRTGDICGGWPFTWKETEYRHREKFVWDLTKCWANHPLIAWHSRIMVTKKHIYYPRIVNRKLTHCKRLQKEVRNLLLKSVTRII